LANHGARGERDDSTAAVRGGGCRRAAILLLTQVGKTLLNAIPLLACEAAGKLVDIFGSLLGHQVGQGSQCCFLEQA
jgi:hypothetical protein